MHPLESPMGLNEERKKKRKTELAHKVSLILVFSVTIFYPNNVLSWNLEFNVEFGRVDFSLAKDQIPENLQ